MNIWDPLHECMPREDLEQLQLERLQATLNRVYRSVACYKKKFDEAGINPEEIRSLDDLAQLPFTTKEDLRLNYPYGMFAVPLREVVRIHSSSGTTGKPTVVGYTKNDIHTWSNLVARFMTAAGVTPDDVVQIAFGYGMFTGAFGLHYGSETIGASVIPMSAGNTEKQIMIMQDYKSTVLVSTPSYAITIASRMEQLGIDPKSLSLKVGLFGAEPWSEGMRKEIESRLFISATDNYGLSEIIGPGVAGECEFKCGMHLSEDAFIAEIIDPETGKVLPQRQRWGTCPYDPDKGSLPDGPLSDQGYHQSRLRKMCLRQDHGSHEKDHGPFRRYAHHQGRKRLSVTDRGDPLCHRRMRTPLSDCG